MNHSIEQGVPVDEITSANKLAHTTRSKGWVFVVTQFNSYTDEQRESSV